MTKISSIKPRDDETRKRPLPQITWNNGTEKSLIEQGFGPEESKDGKYEEPLDVYMDENRFLSELDIRQGPMLREVSRIVRLKAIDHSLEKRELKEYLIYYENWYGKNWMGIDIAPVTDHIEGVYMATTKNLAFDPKTGQGLFYKKGKRQETHYIPFSKKTVDQIIAGHYSDPKDSVRYINDRDSIQYIVKFDAANSPAGRMSYRQRTSFLYEQFSTWTFNDLHKTATRPWGNQDPNYAPTMSSYK